MRPTSPGALALLLTLVLTSACASTPETTLEPLVVLGQPEATYSATVGDPTGTIQPASFEPGGGDEAIQIALSADLLSMDRGALDRLIGWTHGTRVWVTHLESAQALIEAAEHEPGMRLQSPNLMLNAGQSGSISVINQTAYVSHFAIEVQGPAMVADPTVKVAQDGMVLNVTADKGSSRELVALDLEFLIADLERPFAEQEIALPGSSVPATIQIPVAAIQKIATETELAHGECLVAVAHQVGEQDGFLVLLVHASRI